MLSKEQFFIEFRERHIEDFYEYEESRIQEYREEGLEELNQQCEREWEQYCTQQVRPLHTICRLKEKFLSGFVNESIMNPVAGEIYFYQVMSLIAKRTRLVDDMKYRIRFKDGHTRHARAVVHSFWIQDSGSGKGASMAFLEKVCNSINEKLTMYYARGEPEPKPVFTFYNTMWGESPEVFLNYFGTKKTSRGGLEYDFDKEIPGLFQKFDMIFASECAFLFKENTSSRQSIPEYLLSALESSTISKNLVGWNGHETKTQPNFLFVGTTRPVITVSLDFFNMGLFQRTFPYFKSVTEKDRMKLNDAMIQQSNVCDQRFIDMLAQDFAEIYIWRQENAIRDFTFEDDSVFKKLNIQTFDDNIKTMFESYLNHSHKNSLSSFLQRYYADTLYDFCILHAMSEKTTVITNDMILESIALLRTSFVSMCTFAERYISPKTNTRMDVLYDLAFKAVCRYTIDNKETFTDTEMKQYLVKALQLTVNSAQDVFEQLELSKTILKQGDKYFLRKEYAGTPKRIEQKSALWRTRT